MERAVHQPQTDRKWQRDERCAWSERHPILVACVAEEKVLRPCQRLCAQEGGHTSAGSLVEGSDTARIAATARDRAI